VLAEALHQGATAGRRASTPAGINSGRRYGLASSAFKAAKSKRCLN
jgi:hypothetical protein